jgi:PEP-CTERM motif
MNTNLKRANVGLALALVIAVCSFSAKAAVFDFSYTFGSGDVASGSLTGTQNGNFVDSVSNVSVFLNGTALIGNPNLYQPYNFLAGCCFVAGAPVISFNGNLNNFIFANGPPNNGTATNWFAMNGTDIDYWNYGTLGPLRDASINAPPHAYVTDISINGVALPGYNAFDASRWSLTVANPVPEPETYAMLLAGLGLLGFTAWRRKNLAA